MNKQSYEKPALVNYGKISQKTKAGGSNGPEDNANDSTYAS
jgi:hypothetical protein